MISDKTSQQAEVIVKTEGGSAGPFPASSAELPPLPRCTEHPRRELELYCKLCKTAMCLTCKETEHSQCQKKWDEKILKAGLGLKQGIVFEGVERAARRLKEEVLTRLCSESTQKEQALREAAKAVSMRKADIESQLAICKKEVDDVEQSLIKAVTQRCTELRATLEAAAAEKKAALEGQGGGLEEGAGSLQEARERAEQSLSSLNVEERPVEVVEACLRLGKELAAINKASQAKGPVCEANLHVVLTTVNLLVGGVRQLGWSGALDYDVTKCTLDKHGEALFMEPGASFKIMLTTRDKLGQQLKTGGLTVTATVEPAASVDGKVAVEDMGDGTYAIRFKNTKVKGDKGVEGLSLSIKVCGSDIPASPFAITSFQSSIVIESEHAKALHGFLPGKRLELCYRASRDGWSAADFHRLCDGKGPTLVLAKEEIEGYMFGGYTAVPWASPVAEDGNYLYDPDAFLFSIRSPSFVRPFKMPFNRNGDGNAALHHHASVGPKFGKYGDLALLVDGQPRCGTSNLGYSYEVPADRLGPAFIFGHLAQKSKSPGQVQQAHFLAGAKAFKLAEMEVFLVK